MMIERSLRQICRTLWSAIFLVSCGSCDRAEVKDHATRGKISAAITKQAGFPKSLRISIFSNLDDALCVPGEELDKDYNKIEIIQDGHRIFPEEAANVALRDYKGINSLEPLNIVLKGKTDFWFELDGFPLHPGPFVARAHIKVISCKELFERDHPTFLSIPVNAMLRYDPDSTEPAQPRE
jgi:hypothetical protein